MSHYIWLIFLNNSISYINSFRIFGLLTYYHSPSVLPVLLKKNYNYARNCVIFYFLHSLCSFLCLNDLIINLYFILLIQIILWIILNFCNSLHFNTFILLLIFLPHYMWQLWFTILKSNLFLKFNFIRFIAPWEYTRQKSFFPL